MSGLGKDVGRTLTGNLAYALSQWLVLIIVARWGTVEQVGYVTLATAIATPVFVFAGLSLREARSVDMSTTFRDEEYFALRAVTLIVALVVSGLIVAWLGRDGPAAFVAVGFAIVLTKLPHEQATLHYGFCQRAGRFDLIRNSQIARSVLGLVLFCAVFLGTGQLALAFAAQAFGWAAVILVMDLPPLRASGIQVGWGTWDANARARMFALLRWVLPLGMSTAVAVAVMSAPRLVLAEYADFAVLGLFGAIFYFLTANQLLITAVSQASASRLANAYDTGNRPLFLYTLKRVLSVNVAAAIALVLGAWLLGEPVVAAMYGADYVQPFLIMAVAIVGGLQFLSVIARFALNAVKQFRLTLAMNAITLLVALGVALWLVPARGAEGAALAAISAEATRLMLGVPLLFWVIRRMPS